MIIFSMEMVRVARTEQQADDCPNPCFHSVFPFIRFTK